MTEGSLDHAIKRWIDHLSETHGISEDQLCQLLAADEIENRIYSYPKVHSQLVQDHLNLDALGNALQKCWALSGRFDAIRLRRFLAFQGRSRQAIQELLVDFPLDEKDAASRIDVFVKTAIQIGYRTPQDSADRAGAALLASVLLTSYVPSRFVDFRQSRWRQFVSGLQLEIPFDSSNSYGEMLARCGLFAASLSETMVFRRHWGREYALWVLAGLTWKSPDRNLGVVTAPDVADAKSFQEGKRRYRLHLARERNQAVVQRAKSMRQEADPKLHCDVCGFSFIETYDQLGEGFIEAHHIVPLSKISGVVETTVEDLSLVCSNCHRMLHRGDDLLTLVDLKARIQI